MRLIDADRSKEVIEKQKDDNDYMCRLCMESTKEIIDEQPTVFDVDKVVERLEELKMRYFLTIANTGDAYKDCAYKNIANTIDRAIEIIKGGGVE
jgi:hypothetical protein